MVLEKLSEGNEKQWTDFVENNSYSKFHHTLDFKRFLENTYKNCNPFYFMSIKNNKVNALFPFFLVKSKLFKDRLISLPFFDNGGFLGEYAQEDLKELIIELKKIPGLKGVEIKLNSFLNEYKTNRNIFLEEGFAEEDSKNQIVLELKNKEELWEDFDRMTKKGIKKAEKSGLTLKEIGEENELKKFYKIYLKNMKDFGSPQHSYKYFANLFNYMKEEFKGLNCYKGEELIGSLIVLCYNDLIYAAYNSSERKFLKYQPNDLLHWELIKWGAEKGIKYFDFGQCDKDAEKGNHAEGIFRFKSKWKGKIYDKKSFYYNLSKDKNSKENKKNNLKKFRAVWKKLPLPILKIIGPKINSQLGI